MQTDLCESESPHRDIAGLSTHMFRNRERHHAPPHTIWRYAPASRK